MAVSVIPTESENFFGDHGEEEDTSAEITVSAYSRHIFLSQIDEKPGGDKFDAVIQLKRRQAERLHELLENWLKQ